MMTKEGYTKIVYSALIDPRGMATLVIQWTTENAVFFYSIMDQTN